MFDNEVKSTLWDAIFMNDNSCNFQEEVSVEPLAYYLHQFQRLVVYYTTTMLRLVRLLQRHLFSFHIKLLYHHQSSSPIAILLVNLFYRRRKIQTFTRLNLPYVIGIPSDVG